MMITVELFSEKCPLLFFHWTIGVSDRYVWWVYTDAMWYKRGLAQGTVSIPGLDDVQTMKYDIHHP